MSVWVLIISIILILGGIGLLIYGITEHEDKGKKTSTNKILIGVGVVLSLLGLIGIVWFLISKSRKSKDMDTEMQALQAEQAAQNRFALTPKSQQMYPMTPMYNPQYGFAPQDPAAMGFSVQSPVAYPPQMSPQYPPMYNQFGF